MTAESRPSTIKKWIAPGRPWSFPASAMPVLFGTSLAVVIGGAELSWTTSLPALAAMIILHAAANMISDVFDFRRGLDREVTPVSGAIVRGWLTASQVTAGGATLFFAGSLVGLFLLPRVMLASAILHANNWRDAMTDAERRVTTVASVLGDTGSLRYYQALIFG